MSKVGGLVFLLGGAGLAVGIAPSGIDTGQPMPPPSQHQASSQLLAMGSVSLAAQREERRAEEHGRLPPSPSAAVVLPARSDAPVVRVPVIRPDPGAAPSPRDHDELTRALQRELRRVGCYAGAINGAWTASTRTAMKAFTDRVNARLPMAQPDQVLLALVRGHRDKTCARACPPGNDPAQPGQCRSITMFAETATATSAIAMAPAPASAPSPAEAPMAVMPPRPAAVQHRGRAQRRETGRVPPPQLDFVRTIFARLQTRLP